jgi:uncharacterized protein YndB with AHSA1/START domain
MGGYELIVVVVFFLIGYWVVDYFWARVGGQFNFTERCDGEDIEHMGEYFEIDRPSRLAFNFRVPKFSKEPSLIRIDIAPRAFGSELTLVHEGVFPEYASRTEEGWNGVLQSLVTSLR